MDHLSGLGLDNITKHDKILCIFLILPKCWALLEGCFTFTFWVPLHLRLKSSFWPLLSFPHDFPSQTKLVYIISCRSVQFRLRISFEIKPLNRWIAHKHKNISNQLQHTSQIHQERFLTKLCLGVSLLTKITLESLADQHNGMLSAFYVTISVCQLDKFNNATKKFQKDWYFGEKCCIFCFFYLYTNCERETSPCVGLPYILQPYYHNSESFGSPDPWSRRCERRPAGSGGRGSGQSELPIARSCAGRQSRPCAAATLSRSAAGDQTSGCSQMDSVINTNYQL